MRTILTLVSLLAAAPAFGDPCDDLWFTRNLIMDRAGYCFGSVLGQTHFDNAGCTGKLVTLSPDDQDLVRRIQAEERQQRCKVDTAGIRLRIEDIDYRWRMQDLPIAVEHESGCIGWQEAPTPVFAARDSSAAVIGTIRAGDNLRYGHLGQADWDYVLIFDADWSTLRGAGWMSFKVTQTSCRQFAG